jgi:hypothetical protein
MNIARINYIFGKLIIIYDNPIPNAISFTDIPDY